MLNERLPTNLCARQRKNNIQNVYTPQPQRDAKKGQNYNEAKIERNNR